MSKLRKLFTTPGLFFRDYLNKKYPTFNNEQNIAEDEEAAIITHSLKQAILAHSIYPQNTPIDVVFTWVDSKDTAWQQKRQQAQNIQQNIALYGNDNARFDNHDELFYSLHSVEQYLPWVRKIYIVTDNQTPAWLTDNKHPKVEIIDHTQIIDPQFLPTFNSHVIEAHLHNIPGLSEQFIYMNDDVFIARPLPAEHFFHPNRMASLFISDKQISQIQHRGLNTPTLHACLNSIHLLQKIYPDYRIDHPLVHTYIPLTKTYYQKAWQLYKEEIKSFLNNRFRTNKDLNLATFLVPWLMYLDGAAIPTEEICYYFNIRSANAPAQYRKLLAKKGTIFAPHSFCANDFSSNKQIKDYKKQLKNMLNIYYFSNN